MWLEGFGSNFSGISDIRFFLVFFLFFCFRDLGARFLEF